MRGVRTQMVCQTGLRPKVRAAGGTICACILVCGRVVAVQPRLAAVRLVAQRAGVYASRLLVHVSGMIASSTNQIYILRNKNRFLPINLSFHDFS